MTTMVGILRDLIQSISSDNDDVHAQNTVISQECE